MKMILLQHYLRIPFVCRNFISRCRRMHSNSKLNVCGLSHRAVIEVNGKDSSQLLQGLITNDINLLDENRPTIYAMLLNDRGRIMHDLLIYRGIDPGRQFFLECDASEDQNLIDLLKMYKLRKKVALKKRPDIRVCSVFHSDVRQDNSSIMNDLQLNENEHCFNDPRLPQLGNRLLTDSLQCLSQRVPELYDDMPLDVYTRHRHILGVGEGMGEMGGGVPHEHNFDWLNGVSFNKGCYIGQELVARVHFTGQVRKRVMPLKFSEHAESGESIRNLNGKKVGRVLACSSTRVQSEGDGVVDHYVGMGVVNVQQATSIENSGFNTTQFQLVKDEDRIKVVVVTPNWWPKM